MLSNELKYKIKHCFFNKTLKIKSVSLDGKIEIKTVVDVLKHWVPFKNIHKITLINSQEVIVTEDHSIYGFDGNKIYKTKPSDFPTQIVISKQDVIVLIDVQTNIIIDNREYMYDLSVEDNQNYILHSNILVSNSFAPPVSAEGINGFTRCRGYRWPSEQLANHLLQASSFINFYAPISCFDICNWPCILEDVLLRQAMIYALYDLASLWINEEFNYSLNGISLDIQRSDKYSSLASSLQEQINQLLERSKGPLMRSIKGIRQSAYTFSRGAALGPMTSGMNVRRWVR